MACNIVRLLLVISSFSCFGLTHFGCSRLDREFIVLALLYSLVGAIWRELRTMSPLQYTTVLYLSCYQKTECFKLCLENILFTRDASSKVSVNGKMITFTEIEEKLIANIFCKCQKMVKRLENNSVVQMFNASHSILLAKN